MQGKYTIFWRVFVPVFTGVLMRIFVGRKGLS